MSLSVISFLLALITITTLVVMLFKAKARPTRKSYAPNSTKDSSIKPAGLDESLIKSKWFEIQTMQNSGPSGLKAALSDADKLLDYCMIGKGFEGDTMGERLKSGGAKFNNLDAVWSAHKLRNQLAHEVEHDLVPAEVKRSIGAFGAAIKDLGIKI